jgi:hypothetical protein
MIINQNNLSSALFDMYDLKNNFHIKKISHLPKTMTGQKQQLSIA